MPWFSSEGEQIGSPHSTAYWDVTDNKMCKISYKVRYALMFTRNYGVKKTKTSIVKEIKVSTVSAVEQY